MAEVQGADGPLIVAVHRPEQAPHLFPVLHDTFSQPDHGIVEMGACMASRHLAMKRLELRDILRTG